jgi:transcriptional regulator with XRE-family HTH domain
MIKVQSINQLVGIQIRQLRELRQISQEELAFRSDLHRAYIGQIERAERNISIKNLAKIANGLDVAIHELFQTQTES